MTTPHEDGCDTAYLIATDAGGTFTGSVALDEKATGYIGKALSTSLEFSQGVLNAIASVLEQVPGSPARAYRQTRIMSHLRGIFADVILLSSIRDGKKL